MRLAIGCILLPTKKRNSNDFVWPSPSPMRQCLKWKSCCLCIGPGGYFPTTALHLLKKSFLWAAVPRVFTQIVRLWKTFSNRRVPQPSAGTIHKVGAPSFAGFCEGWAADCSHHGPLPFTPRVPETKSSPALIHPHRPRLV